MPRFLPYVLKCLWRHRTRTALTVSGTAVAMFVLALVIAIQDGLRTMTSGAGAERTLVVFQENRFCPSSSHLPEDYAREIRGVPGVRDVMPVQVWTNDCRASLDAVIFRGVHWEQLRQHRDLQLTAGSWDELSANSNRALVGRRLAQRRRLSVGDSFSVGRITVEVAGVFRSPDAAEESLIYTQLAFLQYSPELNAAGIVTMHQVLLEGDADPLAVSRAIDAALRSGPVATATRPKGHFRTSTIADLVDVIHFSHWLAYACVALVLSLVATTAVMSVQDRTAEHALLQAIGLRPARVFRLIVAESLLLTLAGGLLGTTAALVLLAWAGIAVGAEGVLIAVRPSAQLGIVGPAVALGVGLLATVVPAAQAARADIVPALRR